MSQKAGTSVDFPHPAEPLKAAEVGSFHTRIEPPRRWRALDIRDLWVHWELLYFLAWRDIKVRYRQTVLGAAWAVLQPFLTMVVFSIFFGRVANISSEGVPYPVFAYAALVPWTFFSNSLTLGSNYIVQTPDLITKIFFPRLLMPAAAVLGGLFDLVIAFVVLIAMIFYYGIVPGPEIVFVLPLLLLAIATSFGATLWFSALNVRYRDVRYAIPFIAQIWLFATPIVYPSNLVAEPWRAVLGLNPMAGVVEGFRWALLGTKPAPGPLVLVSCAAALLFLIGGLVYFRKGEDSFADII